MIDYRETTYTIETGVWACDVKNSSSLGDSEKAHVNTIIKGIIDKVISDRGIELLASQFRGDGYFLTFDPKNVGRIIFEFAKSFCEVYNKQVEMGGIEKIPLRSYIDHIQVQVDESEPKNVKVVGDDVNAFLRLVDSKQNGRIEIEDTNSVILVASENVFERLEENAKDNYGWKPHQYGDTCYHILQFRPKNYSVHIFGTNNQECQELTSNIKRDLEQAKLRPVISDGGVSEVVIYGERDAERQKVFSSVLEESLTKYSSVNRKRRNNHYIVVFIDLKYSDEPFDVEKTSDAFLNIIIPRDNRSSFFKFLAWSDAATEEYEVCSKEKNITSNYKKQPLTESNRFYYKKIGRGSSKNRRGKDTIYITDLNDCVYLHSFDYHAIELIRETSGMQTGESSDKYVKLHLRKQLELGLLLHDSVLFHSAEVARSKIVYEILKEYEQLLITGRIKLLFSSYVNDISHDFVDYFEKKVNEYNINERYGKNEAESLKRALDDEDHMKKVIELLEKTPQMIKRIGDGTSSLEEMIREDLSSPRSEVIREKREYNRMEDVQFGAYTLSQLLGAKYVDGKSVSSILSDERNNEIQNIIDRLVNGAISASILIGVLEEKIPNPIKENYHGWYIALLHRANYLYARINSETLPYMEFLPSFWRYSFVNYDKFVKDFPFALMKDYKLGCKRIITIRKPENQEHWERFRLYYASALVLKTEIELKDETTSCTYKERIKLAREELKTCFGGRKNVRK